MRCAHWLVGLSVAVTSCFEPLDLPECDSSAQCPLSLPVCQDQHCFHHSVIAPFPWCTGDQAEAVQGCCNLAAGTALEGGGCVRTVAVKGSVEAGPVWEAAAERFFAVVRKEGALARLVEVDSGGAVRRETELPVCEAGQAVEVMSNPGAVWVSCGTHNWLRLAQDQVREFSWSTGAEGGPKTLVGDRWALRTLPEGVEYYRASTGAVGVFELPVGDVTEEVGSLGNARTDVLYVPLDGGRRVGMVELPDGNVATTVEVSGQKSLLADMALSDDGTLWLLTQDGSISAWSMESGKPAARQFLASGWGRPAPRPGTFAVAGEVGWYLGDDGSLVTASVGDTVTALGASQEQMSQFQPLLDGDWVWLGSVEGGASVGMQFDTSAEVWGGVEGPLVRTAPLDCDQATMSQATSDGVMAVGCAGWLRLYAVPSPGQEGTWTQPHGAGGCRCIW